MSEVQPTEKIAPSEAAIYERARRLADMSVRTVALQYRRVKTKEPEDSEFFLRRWTDFLFLIGALTRCRRAAKLASQVGSIKAEMEAALRAFDNSLPSLKTMRDTAEHIDDYALERGQKREISRMSLEVGVVGSSKFEWLGLSLDADKALESAQRLYSTIKSAKILENGR